VRQATSERAGTLGPVARPAPDPHRGALAGATAALAWAAAEPLARRLCRTPYSDLRLLGRAVTGGRAWPAAGVALHLVNGALFGLLFDRLGGRGWRQGLGAAMAETAATWPGMALIDRFHPDRRSGAWPPLLRHRPTIVEQILVHALFGVVLGLLHPRRG
jgi:hypothetical protein